MDNNVMRTYTTVAKRPQHYIQYDQGEDRWLCTLMLKQGWRVEYSAASDSFTACPEVSVHYCHCIVLDIHEVICKSTNVTESLFIFLNLKNK